jgi:hypothetical protein
MDKAQHQEGNRLTKARALFIALVLVNVTACTAGGDSVLVLDTFALCPKCEGGLPCGWKPNRPKTDMFSVHSQQGSRFLSVASQNDATTLAKESVFDVTQFPFLAWKWRVWQLPLKAREDQKKINDSGAGVYVIFKGNFGFNKTIKYVWSTTLPAGTAITSPYRADSKVVVLESGAGREGEWLVEKVNVQNDYARLFGSVPPLVEAIGILTDSDDTRSIAKADYGPFMAEAK